MVIELEARAVAKVAGFAPVPKVDEVTVELDIVLGDGDTIDGTEFRLDSIGVET